MTAPVFCVVDQNLKDLIGHHYEYDRACVEGARARGFTPICLGHQDAIDIVADTLPLRRAFSKGMWWRPEAADLQSSLEQANRHFAAELDAALADIELGPDAVVFGHMIVHGQMQAWADFVRARCGPGGPLVVLLLRYQPAFYRGALCEAAFRSLERSVASGARVRLASDSARLSAQLERLTTLPVETFPIPHTHAVRADRERPPGALRVASLGNARDEKGLLELFDAALILQQRGDVDVEFVLQVNDPNAEITPAVQRFAADPPGNVRLIETSLSSDAYAELLASADIVATPYWRSIYEARTSGVFLEAVAAGKPVVCTAETWMADELAKAGAGVLAADRDAASLALAIAEAAARFDELSAKAMADRPKWLAFHNPTSFVDALLDGAPGASRPRERRAAVLFPWGDDLVTPSSGAAQRVSGVIRLLETRFDRIRVLQDVNRKPRKLGRVSYEPDPLLERAEGQTWFLRARAWLRRMGAENGEEIYALLHLAPERDREFCARVDEIVAWADVVYLDYPFWAKVVKAACERRGKTLVLTSHDVISDQCRSSTALKLFTRRLELQSLRLADHHIALSQQDAERFARWGAPAIWSPIGFDPVALRRDVPGDSRGLLNRLCGWPAEDRAPIMLFMGSRFRPNQLAAEAVGRIAEAFGQRHPDVEARFVVCGACHEPERRDRFAALGFVSPLVAHLLRRECALVLAPLTIGTGVSVKSLEAFACGTPVLSTTVGVRGIPGADRAAMIVDDLDAWPDVIAQLLADPARCAALVRGADALAAENDYRRTYAVYLELGGVATTPLLRADAAAPPHDLLLDAAEAAFELGLAETGAACLSAVLEHRPSDSRALLLNARSLALRDDFRGAFEALEAALRRGADPVAVLRARAALTQGEAARAGLAIAARIEVNRSSALGGEPAVREIAWQAYHGGERDWALALAQEVVSGWPVYADAKPDYDYLCASILAERGEGDPAAVERHARRALAHGFEPFWCHMALARAAARQSEGWEQEREAWEGALLAAIPAPDRRLAVLGAATELAWRRFETGRSQVARDAAEWVIAHAPDHPGALYLAAETALRDGRSEAALQLFRRAGRAGADRAWCLTHESELQLGLGDPPAAIDAALGALALPGEAHRSSAVSVVCNALWRRYEQADPDLSPGVERALQAGVEDGRVWYLKGEAASRRGAPLQALSAYDRALAAGFDAYWALRRRAEAAEKLGRDDAADRFAAAERARTVDERFEVLQPLFAPPRSDLTPEQAQEGFRAARGDSRLLDLIREALQHAESRRRKARAPAAPLPTEVHEAWRAFEAQRYDEVLDLAQRLLQSPAQAALARAHGHYLTAECLQILGRDLGEALQHYDAAHEGGFTPYWVHFNRGQLRAKLGDEAGAVQDLRAAVLAADDPDQKRRARDSLEQRLELCA